MKIKIGPYINWIGPFQIVDFFFKPFIKDEDKLHDLGEKFSKVPMVSEVCDFVHSKKARKIKIKIDDYDVWGLDHTLAMIIHPALIRLKEKKHGAPFVDDVDVPEHLRSTAAPPKENEWDTDANHFLRWDYVLDEMIWAFGEIKDDTWEDQYHTGDRDYKHLPVDEDGNPVAEEDAKFFQMVPGPKHTAKFDAEGHKAHWDRIQKGTILFGKYYGGLWD